MGGPNTVVDKTITRMIGSGRFNGITLSAYRESDSCQFHFSGGALDFRSPYFATGTSKLYVTAILMQLRAEGKIALDTPFLSYLDNKRPFRELHVRDGVDFTDQITIRHLMSHTSGLSDSMLYKSRKRTMKHVLAKGVDSSWSLDDMIARTRTHRAVSLPGQCKKATFAEANVQILSAIIESIEGKSYGEVLDERIIRPLGLRATYLFSDPSDDRPLHLMAEGREVKIPRTIVSFGAGSGVVTTSREALIFLRAFYEGYLFDRNKIKDLHEWRPLLYPSEYGVGLARLKLPRLATLPMRLREPLAAMRPIPTLYGHIGMGCSSLFYAPDLGIYIAGTTNQLADPMACFRLVLRAVESIHYGEVDAHLSGSEFGVSRYASRHRITKPDEITAPDWAPKRPFKSFAPPR